VSDDTIKAGPLPVNIAPSQQDATIAVARLYDSAGLPADDFTVTIDWGDGSTSAGTVTPGPFAQPVPLTGDSGGTNGSSSSTPSDPSANPIFYKLPYLVTGQHHYPTAGNYTIKVTIKDTLGAEADVTTTANVSDTPVVTIPPPGKFDPIEQPVVAAPTNPVTSSNGGSQSSPPASSSSTGSSNSTTTGSTTTTTTSSTATQPTVTVGAAHPGKSSRKHRPLVKTHPTILHAAVSPHAPGGGKGHVHG
jgi:hypothetical protein